MYSEMRLSGPLARVSGSRAGLGNGVMVHNAEMMAVWSSNDTAMQLLG